MNYQSSLSVRPLSIPPLSYVMASTYTSEVAKQYLIAQSTLYSRNHIVFTCSGGSSMDYILEKDRGYSYRYSEVNSMGATCCIDANSQFVIVEIDESKFGKRKYHQGHRVEGVWVLGSIEKTAERKTFLMTVPHRDAATFLQVIKKYTAYGGLASVIDMNYTHRTVNHNVEYVTSDDIHINTIEGLWNGIKMNYKARLQTKQMVPWMLMEFIWRKKYENRLWQGILKILAEVSFGSIVDNPIYTNYEYLEDDEDEEYTDSTIV
ncbi:hypothetical protein PHYBLDRAFT_73821 [Phycomyces blakesleeanus NRRL 1555(-)]|uniref:ISXO2-like transposase domain-containing protein n=1 Tax=Phycomyces blakesleeanus (strain ATCC 8743b / DSM 1359 / FGSC 10004 / NBRC 33097 / NRRL 1555) TaxID=763407 RepID=A0A163DG05_PHYB8|nr:hypothetical protein PHYBLDRAFT_73821 [Phycomyces blakesleeanus NRRL 1555(-)]OAD70990.1 hypothetical protein PHYBLDRAFT_73821 [Phycomyces blakesleeanus NRRL 1555(-)]|eukprot:XP_018289030.1 hypothetical protein PHYBLDRAFT_73821 [Phycomyces blakesleeanus NRRL 1555(-)]